MLTDSMALARVARPNDAAPLAAEAPEHQERILPVKGPLCPGLNLLIEIFRQPRDRRLRKLSRARLGGNLLDSAGADSPVCHTALASG